jgi:hypothetical protein
MPPIVPPFPDLLSAPPPSAPAGTTPASGRRLTIVYQNQGETPVAPKLDSEYDIAQPVLDRYAQYVGERTQVNNIPIVGLPVQAAGYGAAPESGQQQFLDSIPSARDEFDNRPSQFDPTIVTNDALGTNYKTNDATGLRNFSLSRYNKFDVNTNQAAGHGAVVDKTMLESTGYNSSNKFIPSDISQNKQDNRIKLGSYFYKNANDLSNGVNYVRGSYVRAQPATATDAPPMTVEQMKDVGLNILFEAVQGAAGLDHTVRSQDATHVVEAEARMVIPSEQRIGKRVSLGRFTPAYQIKKLTNGAAAKPSNESFIDTTDDVQTYGSFYNPYSQFDSLVSIGQIALTVAMILAFVLLLDIIVAFLHIPSVAAESNFVTLNAGEKKRLLGASVLQNSGVYPLSSVDAGDVFSQISGFAQLVGTNGLFPQTAGAADNALNAGIQEFFGFSFTNGGTLGTGVTGGAQAVNASLKVLTESGRLTVILREILRSGISLVEDTSVDFTGGAGIAGIGNLIRKIRDLKIVRLIGVLMSVGDRVDFESRIRDAAGANYNLPSQNNEGSTELMRSGSNVSYIDSLPDARKNYISKSRERASSNLAWSNKAAGMFKLPLVNASDADDARAFAQQSRWTGVTLPNGGSAPNVNSDNLYHGNLSDASNNNALNKGRLDSNAVSEIERNLEADYMPFYIQDLRTNEILAFHAFLEEASEDFNVEYTAQEGYGRMDKVQIYKGTTRTISVNFKMIATNPDDHDLMWYKINSLAMMIYPQWTQGRKIELGQNIKFVQPFSQIPGATPVIRLRLGDLYKSNYSKMAVARLFGISTLVDYNIDNTRAPTRNATAAPAHASNPPSPELNSVQAQIRNLQNPNNIIGAANVQDKFKPDDTIIFYTAAPLKADFGTSSSNIGRLHGHFVTKYLGKATDDSGIRVLVTKYRANAQVFGDPVTEASVVVRRGRSAEKIITWTALNNGGEVFDRFGTITELQTRLSDQETAARTEQQTGDQQTATLNSLRTTFYSPDANPVMKAFASSGGKGLAGVITNFKIDYSEAKGNWGSDTGTTLRAPMFVTIQLQMAVIHDITPGLDANGIMMAPIWPVGNTSNYFVQSEPTTPPDATRPNIGNDTGDNQYFRVDNKALYYNRKD